MKTFKTILSLLFLLTVQVSYSQNFFQSVGGRISDKDSKEPLPGATIVLEGSTPWKGTTSDSQGYFRLDRVPVGRQSIRVSFIGYKEVIIPEVIVTTGKEVILNVELSESLSQLNEVKVVANQYDKDKSVNSMATISARKLNMEDAGRYAGGFYDPSRMVSAFAGVSAVEGDGVNDIIIRGNSSRGLLWKLEGIEIPNPNHFTDGQGSTGGAVSIITSNMLSTSDFYTGAFPAEYGNATAGIMDLNLRTGNPAKREYGFQLGVIGTAFTLEGGFSPKSKASYLVNYRYSTFSYLSRMGLIDLGNNNVAPVFQDLTANFNFPTAKAGTFTLFTVGGKSSSGTEPEKEGPDRVTYDDQYFEKEEHNMAVAGLKHFYLFRDRKTSVKTILAYTTQGDKWNNGDIDQQDERHSRYYSDISFPSLKASVTLNTKLNANHTLRTGVVASKLYYNMFDRDYDWEKQHLDTILNQDGNSMMFQSFIQWKYRLSERLEFNSGLHLLYLKLNNQAALEPRAGLRYSLDQKQSLSLGFGIHSRAEAISAYMALIPDSSGTPRPLNKNMGFTKSMHFVLGYDYAFAKDWRAKVETYYQHLYNIPVPADPNSLYSGVNFGYGIPELVVANHGIAYNYGAELTIEKFFTRNYYMLGTVSVFDSKYRANNQKWYNTVYNSRYVGNLLAGKDFKTGKDKQNVFGLNSKIVLRGGFRISPIDEAASIRDQEVRFDETRMNEAKLPDFFRIDMGTYLRINKQKYAYILSLDVQNVTNRKNTIGYDFSGEENRVVNEEAMGLVPILNFRIEF